MTRPSRLSRFAGDERGVAFLEFALMLPIFLGFILMAAELANYLVAKQRAQKLAFMTSDMLARSTVMPDEKQVEDIFLSMDVAAEPFRMREDGRVILTGIVGMEDGSTGKMENKLVWQRCDGNLTSFQSHLGREDSQEARDREAVVFPQNIQLPKSQMIISAEVALQYEPITSDAFFDKIGVDRLLTARSFLRTRSAAFTDISVADGMSPMLCHS
ncbi:TadE/TadG family type IV pilus assembly protein [Pacificimonas flava]|nr:TadE/TadG family type IV pilus assembly protein [Pacificimonas flava]MBB5279703.1 hypothetical protein [Pacificimonas flava]